MQQKLKEEVVVGLRLLFRGHAVGSPKFRYLNLSKVKRVVALAESSCMHQLIGYLSNMHRVEMAFGLFFHVFLGFNPHPPWTVLSPDL